MFIFHLQTTIFTYKKKKALVNEENDKSMKLS